MSYGMIDVSSCADIVSKAYMENMVPTGIIIGSLVVLSIVLFFFYIYQLEDIKLMKKFLQKEKLLQKYVDWLKDRKYE